MAENLTGWRSVLSVPWVYEAVQHAVGARKGMRTVVESYVRPWAGCKLLDIGCGPGALLRYLPDVDYVGFDHSDEYINSARETYGERGRFYCDDVANWTQHDLSHFDIVVAYGILHHLDDDRAKRLIEIASSALKPNGRLITADPCYFPDQDPVTRFVSSQDRGQNVRFMDAYRDLALDTFGQVAAHKMHGYTPFPHAACILECQRLVA